MTAVKGKTKHKGNQGDVFSHYEKAVKAVHSNKYGQAAKLLDEITSKFATELDVLARVKTFQKICARQLEQAGKGADQPQSAEGAYDLGVYLHNNGDFDGALEEFKRALKLGGKDLSFIHYGMAASLVRSGKAGEAVDALSKAAEGNKILCFSAANDPDFATLLRDEKFRSLLESVKG